MLAFANLAQGRARHGIVYKRRQACRTPAASDICRIDIFIEYLYPLCFTCVPKGKICCIIRRSFTQARMSPSILISLISVKNACLVSN